MGKLELLLLILLGGLQCALWFGKNGMQTYTRLQQEVVLQKNDNNQLKRRNEVLLFEVNDLVDGLDAIEERARYELDMIKPEEQFYRFSLEQGVK